VTVTSVQFLVLGVTVPVANLFSHVLIDVTKNQFIPSSVVSEDWRIAEII
jgi:hypothetical protein